MLDDKIKPNRQVSEFTALMKTVKEMGLLRKRYARYWIRFSAITLSLVAIAVAMVILGNSAWVLLLAPVLAFALGQVMFLGHDAAHSQIFNSNKWNTAASLVLADLYAGMSYGWWNHKHSRHHAKPNQVGSDPDINSDVIIFHTQDLKKVKTGVIAWLTARQGWLFFPLLLLEGLNLHFAGIKTLANPKTNVKYRKIEILFVTLRLGGYFALVFLTMPIGLGFAFVGIQMALFGLYMGAVFAPNHKGMPIVPANSRIDFLRRQVLMSRNIKGGRVTDFLMGGLNYQIEHHLFPSMPRASLRHVQPIVREFCKEKLVPYQETTALESYGIVIRYLNKVGLSAMDPFQCPLAFQLRTTEGLQAKLTP